jgi:1-acyl-sn-glycerol-3-phosphate acyltransferase
MIERSFFWKSCQIIARLGTTLLFDLKVYGKENVPRTGGALLVANHQSYIDPVAVAVQLTRPVSYMAKSELFENPHFRWLIRSLHAFPVQQGKGDVGAVKEVIRRLGDGHIVNIYPEGSRTDDGEIAKLEKGIALIIRKISVPVIPVAIDGSFDAWHKDWAIFRRHPIRVKFGKPVFFKNKKGDEIVRELESRMRSLLTELRAMR